MLGFSSGFFTSLTHCQSYLENSTLPRRLVRVARRLPSHELAPKIDECFASKWFGKKVGDLFLGVDVFDRDVAVLHVLPKVKEAHR